MDDTEGSIPSYTIRPYPPAATDSHTGTCMYATEYHKQGCERVDLASTKSSWYGKVGASIM